MRQRVALDTREIVGGVEPREFALDKLMNLRTQSLRFIERTHSDRKIFALPRQRVSLGKILPIQTGTALPAEMTAPGRRCGIDARRATGQPERIARNSRGHDHRCTTAPPTRITMAIDNIEDAIDFVSDRLAKASTRKWTDNHLPPILTLGRRSAREIFGRRISLHLTSIRSLFSDLAPRSSNGSMSPVISRAPRSLRIYVQAHSTITMNRLRNPIRKKMCTNSHISHATRPDTLSVPISPTAAAHPIIARAPFSP